MRPLDPTVSPLESHRLHLNAFSWTLALPSFTKNCRRNSILVKMGQKLRTLQTKTPIIFHTISPYFQLNLLERMGFALQRSHEKLSPKFHSNLRTSIQNMKPSLMSAVPYLLWRETKHVLISFLVYFHKICSGSLICRMYLFYHYLNSEVNMVNLTSHFIRMRSRKYTTVRRNWTEYEHELSQRSSYPLFISC